MDWIALLVMGSVVVYIFLASLINLMKAMGKLGGFIAWGLLIIFYWANGWGLAGLAFAAFAPLAKRFFGAKSEKKK